VRRIVAQVLAGERRRADVSVSFVGRVTMQALNQSHKGKRRPTDVLAFALPQPGGGTVGDIYICPAVAADQARRHGVTRTNELRRLVVHGVLHVLGYDHPAGEGREASAMWHRQERYLGQLG
jgi:probable rRNA maturation factor